MLALSLLVAPEVVVMVTAGATGGGGFSHCGGSWVWVRSCVLIARCELLV